MSLPKYLRVTIKSGTRVRRFWAKDKKRKGKFILYTPVNKEGDEYARYKGGILILRKDLIDKRLIIKERPAIMSSKYGELRIKG
jgi:hypothetical protein